MKKALSLAFLSLVSLLAYPQLSYESLLNSFEGFENGKFENYLTEKGFEKKLSPKNMPASAELWQLGEKGRESGDILIEKKTFPWNSLWVEFIRHSSYHEIRSDIIKNCDHAGFFGCSEVETWDSYKHDSGIEFRLIELNDTRETGRYIVEVIQK